MIVKMTLIGRVIAVLLAQNPDSLVSTRQAQVQVDLQGFSGDKHYGMTHRSGGRTPHFPRGTEIRNDRQVSIISTEEMAQVATSMSIPEILPEWLGANLLLEGISHLTQLPPSTRLFFAQGAVLVVQQENMPCVHPGKIIEKFNGREGLAPLFVKAALHQRGMVACVERAGSIAAGDVVRVEIPEQVLYSW